MCLLALSVCRHLGIHLSIHFVEGKKETSALKFGGSTRINWNNGTFNSYSIKRASGGTYVSSRSYTASYHLRSCLTMSFVTSATKESCNNGAVLGLDFQYTSGSKNKNTCVNVRKNLHMLITLSCVGVKDVKCLNTCFICKMKQIFLDSAAFIFLPSIHFFKK
jgi:hypothetical protein